jgi:hypothetical protein
VSGKDGRDELPTPQKEVVGKASPSHTMPLQEQNGLVLDGSAVEILKEFPQIIEDLGRVVAVVRENLARLGLDDDIEIEGFVDYEDPELKTLWVTAHVGPSKTVERQLEIQYELLDIVAPVFKNAISKRMIMVTVEE